MVRRENKTSLEKPLQICMCTNNSKDSLLLPIYLLLRYDFHQLVHKIYVSALCIQIVILLYRI